MQIHVVRHAHAGSRKNWNRPDPLRPLSTRGTAEAEAIAADLSDAGVEVLWSSPFVRCRQTLDPLADRLGLPVEDRASLAEGATGAQALDDLLAAAAGGTTVVGCSHGDVIPELVAEARRRGANVHGPDHAAKGARYVLTVVDGRVTTLDHVPAPEQERRDAEA